MNRLLLEARELSGLEAATAVLLAAAFLIFFVQLFRRSRNLPLFAARAAATLLGILLLTGPSIVLRRPARPPVAMVLDSSASMAVEDADQESSRAKAAAAAVGLRMPLLNRVARPVLFQAGNGLHRIEDPGEAKPRDALSDFSTLDSLSSDVPGLKGIFFISDGRLGGGRDPLPLLAARGIPVYAIGVGDLAVHPDLAVDFVHASPFAFKNTESKVAVRLRLRGLPPGNTSLTVVEGGKVVGRTTASWNKEEVLEVSVPFLPSRTGLETFRLAAAPVAGENNLRNNSVSFTVDVARDRRRILYICGRPGPHYAFLRQQIKSDPTCELISFVILRNAENLLTVPDRELSLIPFPDQAKLLGGLSDFDAVLFEDFSFNRFGIGTPGMEALRRFVEKGGGFLIAGEGSSFAPSSPYHGSPMEPLIPFFLDRPPVPAPTNFRAAPLLPDLPLTALDEGESWSTLPTIIGDGWFPAALRPGAVPILGAAVDGAARPWAASLRTGKGRVMAVAELTTWRWALGGATGPYARFWSRALSWLVGGEESSRLRLELPPDGAAPGQETVVRAFGRDETGKPLSGAEIKLGIVDGDGRRRELPMDPVGDGEYAASVLFNAPGEIRLTARARRGGRSAGETTGLLQVGRSWDESRDVSPDFAFLSEMSRSSGGRFTPLSGFNDAWVSKNLEEISWETDRRIPLAGPWTIVLLLGLLLAEWTFRRWRGHP